MDYLKELVQATLREDNDHLTRQAKREAGEGKFRPHPLPQLQRAVLERLLETLSEFDTDANRVQSEADTAAREILTKALQARRNTNVGNKDIAEAVHKSLYGDDTAWNRLVRGEKSPS